MRSVLIKGYETTIQVRAAPRFPYERAHGTYNAGAEDLHGAQKQKISLEYAMASRLAYYWKTPAARSASSGSGTRSSHKCCNSGG